MSQTDTAVHPSLRESFSSRQVQRMAQSFETFEEAKERAKRTPPPPEGERTTTHCFSLQYRGRVASATGRCRVMA